MKLISILLALLNSLVAGLILAFSLSPAEFAGSDPAWTLGKAAAAVFVMAAGVLTWKNGAQPGRPAVMLAGSLALVALGAAAVVWTFHLSVTTGDLEAYMVMYGGSLMAQGTASALGFQQEPTRPVLP